jgi:hypothetical protein
MKDHPKIWTRQQHWFENLNTWVTQHVACEYKSIFTLGLNLE